MGSMNVLTQDGDISIEWDVTDPESTESARKEWVKLEAQGYNMFEALPGKRGKRVKKFDKDLGRVIVAPATKTKAQRKTGARPKAMAGGPIGHVVGTTKTGYRPRRPR